MQKVAFTPEDDALLLKFIATYNPQLKGRLGMKLYERLVENAERKWSFSSRHSVQSWRERYKNNQPWFDAKILKYQEKHGISTNAFDNPSSQFAVQSSVTKIAGDCWRTNIWTAPVGENGAKKRRREVEAEDTNLHPGVVKKMRQETLSVQGSQPYDRPPHSRSPSAELRSEEKVGAESSYQEEEEAAPVIGPDDYTGALTGSGESDQEVGSQSKDWDVSASVRVSRPSLASTRSAGPRLLGATVTHGEPSISHQQHDISSKSAVAEASGIVRDSIGAPLQPSQEATPPHTSAINSPRSSLQHQPSPMKGALSQPETGSRQISSISLKRTRIPPRPNRTRDEDDIFSTPPPQAIRASPPPGTRGRDVPHLVEGPFRSTYTNPNGQFGDWTHDTDTDGADEEWPPPRRGKRRSRVFLEGLSSTPSREREQSISNAQPQRSPSRIPDAVTSQATRAETSTVAKTSKDAHRPPQPQTMSVHGSVQAKDPGPVTNHNRLLFPAAPSHELPPPAPGPPSKRASLGRSSNSAPLNDSSENDPFKVLLVNRETRRWTLAGNSEIPRVDARREDLVRRTSVHHIDLRALHLGKSVGTSLSSRAISVDSSNVSKSSSAKTKKWPRRPSRSSTPPNLSLSNKKLVLSLGLEAVYSRMAENHKFHIDVVREVAAEQASLEDTDRVLCNMRLAATREYGRLLRQNDAAYSPGGRETEESEEEDEDVDNSGDEEDDSLSVQPSRGSNYSPTSPVPQGRARRLALKIPMASPDSSPTRPTDYSPPTPTRARAFRRLERQGRVEEAKLREARHARRSLQSSSAEASPEADGQRLTTYLLQEREDEDGVPLEKPRGLNDEDASYVTKAMVNTHLSRRSELDDEDADIMEVEEQVNGGGDCLALPDPQSMDPEAESHIESTGVDNGMTVANARQSPPGNVLTEEIGHSGFSPDIKYAEKATSSLAYSTLATLSALDTEWTNSEDELLLDGSLTEHKGLVRRKGLYSVKFRTAHLYSLLLDN